MRERIVFYDVSYDEANDPLAAVIDLARVIEEGLFPLIVDDCQRGWIITDREGVVLTPDYLHSQVDTWRGLGFNDLQISMLLACSNRTIVLKLVPFWMKQKMQREERCEEYVLISSYANGKRTMPTTQIDEASGKLITIFDIRIGKLDRRKFITVVKNVCFTVNYDVRKDEAMVDVVETDITADRC